MKKPVILFQGDSVTDCNRHRQDPHHLGEGYVAKVAEAFPQLTILNRGISGNRTGHLVERWQEDAMDLNPDFISIFIGINDVWHHFAGDVAYSIEAFEENYRKILTQITLNLPDTKILLIEPFVLPIGVFQPSWRPALDQEIQVIRRLAKQFAHYLIPMDALFAEHALSYPYVTLAEDGVHPTPLGHQLIANEIGRRLEHYVQNK